MKQTANKDLNYYKENAQEDYIHVPISVLRYITELEEHTSNELASYKAELRAKIEESVSAEKDVLQSPLNYHHKDVESARKIYNTAKSILVILEDNPTEK